MIKICLIAGSTFLLSGTLLFGIVFLAIANFAGKMTGWSDPPGKFAIAMDETMMTAPHVISILFMIIGIIFYAVAIYMALPVKKAEDSSNEISVQ